MGSMICTPTTLNRRLALPPPNRQPLQGAGRCHQSRQMGLRVSAFSFHPPSFLPSPTLAHVSVPGGNDGAQGNSNGSGADEHVPEAPMRRPAEYLPAYHQQVQLQAANIQTAMTNTAGIKTYKTTWRMYDIWHMQRFGARAPRCQPWLDIIWVDRGYATDFLATSAGCNGMTSSMVNSLPLKPALPLVVLPEP